MQEKGILLPQSCLNNQSKTKTQKPLFLTLEIKEYRLFGLSQVPTWGNNKRLSSHLYSWPDHYQTFTSSEMAFPESPEKK